MKKNKSSIEYQYVIRQLYFFILSTVTADPVSYNIIGKNTWQSSTYKGKFPSSAAVDGCTDPDIEKGCCTHTTTDSPAEWWSVDLGQTVILNSVTVLNRDNHRKYFYHQFFFQLEQDVIMIPK